MPPFRVGKPRIRLTFGDPQDVAQAEQLLRWDLVEYEDPVGQWDPLVPERVTILRTGLYAVQACVDRTAVTATSIASLRLMRNDLVKIANYRTNSAAGALAGSVATVIELDAGDFLVCRSQLATGAGNTATVGTGTHLAVTRIGPERWT